MDRSRARQTQIPARGLDGLQAPLRGAGSLPATRGRQILNFAAFVAGFGLVAVALTAGIPPVRPQLIAAKLEWLAAHGEQYDTFFIGSSRVHRQIIPDLFDAEMERLGVKTRSFNLAADGMRPPEDELVLERAFASRKNPARLLVVECNPIDSDLAEEDKGTARAVYWHDTARLMRLWRKCWSDAPSKSLGGRVSRVWKRLRQFPSHAQHWIWNGVRLGLGNDLLSQWVFGSTPRDDAREVGANGYHPPKSGEQMTGGVLRAYERQLAAALKTPGLPEAGDAESQSALAWKKALAQRHGARLVLLSSPFLRPEIFQPRSREGIAFLDYSDPALYPGLYAPENRRDPGHLNMRGSEIYTRLVARQLAAELKIPAMTPP